MILPDRNDTDVDLETDTGGGHEGLRPPPTLVDVPNVTAPPHDPGGAGLPDPRIRITEYLAGDPRSGDHGTPERNEGSGREEGEG